MTLALQVTSLPKRLTTKHEHETHETDEVTKHTKGTVTFAAFVLS